MNKDEFQELMKIKIDDIKEETLHKLLAKDKHYQETCTQHEIAEQNYRNLNLTPEQEDTIDALLSCTDTNNMEYSTISYLAGLFDSPKIAKALHFPISENDLMNSALDRLYCGQIFPYDQLLQSPAVKIALEDILTSEIILLEQLTTSQQSKFEDLREKQTHILSLIKEDSFLHAFRIGATLMMDILN